MAWLGSHLGLDRGRWAPALAQAVGRRHFFAAGGVMAAVSSKAAPEREAKTSLLKKMVFSSTVKEAALRHLSGV